jgi:hypothetical protein
MRVSLSSSTRTPTQGARAAGRPAAGGTNRLPSGRERRPALAALAVILILLGAAGSALIALNSGNRSDFVAISATRLEPGHKLDRKDLSRGDLAGATGGLIPWSEADKYIGQYTTGWLYKDQFVTPANFTAEKPIPADGAQIGVSLEGGRAPSDGIEVGDIVAVIRVPTSTQDTVSGSTLVKAAVVTATSGAIIDAKTNAGTTLNVTVLVPAQSVPEVAAAAAAKTLVLAKLSPSVTPEVARGDGTK